MHNSIKCNKSSEAGFTLIEIAIGIIIIGLILIPSITLYKDFQKNKDWLVTEHNKNAVESAIGGFSSNYGRYPCPSSMTAARGDADYGFELANCQTSVPATGTCFDGICAYASPNASLIVLVGALPYKNLNLLEDQAYDGQRMKFTYAVTLNLTETATFSVDGGAVGIVKSDDILNSAIGTPNTAHYAVVSHGPNKAGAFSATTVQIPCTEGSTVEQENCDGDSIFVTGEIATTFDDRIAFFDGVLPTEWKKQDSTSIDIFLKDSNSLALGASNTTNLNAAQNVLVRNIGADSGSAISETSFFVERLCEDGATGITDCFEPELIAGALTPDGAHPDNRLEAVAGSGMSCYDGTNDEFLTGIQNGTPQCSDEIFLSCPSGNFVVGVDAGGNLRCNSEPEERCLELDTTNFCGDSVTLAESASNTSTFEFSGECRMFPGTVTNTTVRADVQAAVDQALADNPGDFPAAITQARTDVDAAIATINATARDIQQCSDVTSNPAGLVRDTFQCESGTWSVRSSHETRWGAFPSNTNAGGSWPAENSYVGTDPSNNNHYHDCWCREDYRAVYDSGIICPSTGDTGLRIRIQKHRCPRTDHNWQTIYDERWLFCGCTPGTETETPTCDSYYDTVNGTSGTTGLDGVVTLTYDTVCDGDGNLVRSPTTPTAIDTTACSCASNSPNYQRDPCPLAGQTNSWNSPYGPETNVTEIREQPWICPGTTSGGLPDPGYYGSFATVTGLSIPACSCDSTPVNERLDCPDGETGLGIFYDAPRDCTTGLADPDQSTWVETSRSCNSCEWVSSGAPTTTEFSLGPEPKSTCFCGSPNEEFCSEFSKLGEYNTWSPCQCNAKL